MSLPTAPSPDQAGNTAGTGDQNIRDAVIRFAGNSQDGIQSIGGFLARLAGRTQQDVMTYMTIPATISGGPSIFQVHIGSGEVLSAGDDADFLVTFYQDSYENHIGFLRKGGVCIYDSDKVTPDDTDKDHRYVGVPITTATVEALGGTSKDKGKNMFVLGIVAQIFQLNVEKLKGIIERQFGKKKEDVLRNVMLAFDSGYGYQVGDVARLRFHFHPGHNSDEHRLTTDGNQLMACGLLAAGVRYGASYPITPWSSIMESLRTELPRYGGIFVQTEDEIAAVATALGFAYAGHLAVTGSSGPGLSLKMEALSYAVMAELPLIVVNVQRGGPSTGMPTSVEQSDLMQAIYGSHGDCPRVVLAPKDVEDCFYIAIEAGRIAKKYSCPVIILSDQSISSRIEAFKEPNLDEWMTDAALDLTPREADWRPYPTAGEVNHAAPGTRMLGGKYPVVTGLEHDEWGHPSASPKLHTEMTARRRDKLIRLMEEIPVPAVHGDQNGDVLLVGWGSTSGPLKETTERLRAQGRKVGCMILRHIHPLPNGLDGIFNKFKKIAVVEMNDRGLYGFGQLATMLRARLANPNIQSVCKTDGLSFKVREIIAGIEKIQQS
ncbi:MAG: 2-oxoacid:acceptor oxidoreductase subunit alpha [Verrucomicrobiales bacterium]|nr:2-oxoacid:acceptor oxidoreductase subunit alpha [Verrucomicrobiales bacterium]